MPDAEASDRKHCNGTAEAVPSRVWSNNLGRPKPDGSSKRSVLRKRKTGQGRARGAFSNLHSHRGCIGGGHLGGTQDCVLSKDLVINLGDQIILTVLVLAPNLPELNRLNRHFSSSNCRAVNLRTTSFRICSRLTGAEAARQLIGGHSRL